ncbi:MAG: hypothetical protein WCK57_05855 [Verrucomicrobiae bacterium]
MRQFFHPSVLALLFAVFCARAQTSLQISPGGLIQLQTAQPAVDVTTPVTATAEFDPPVVRPGDKVFYRVTLDAAEAAIDWPEKIPAPSELKFGASAHGQTTQNLGNKFRSLTAFIYEVRPVVAGNFIITNFTVTVAGVAVEIPAATLEVVATHSDLPAPRQLQLETSVTNLFLGEPFRVRVLLPAGIRNEIEALREIQLNSDGLMIDKTAMRQSIEVTSVGGQLKPALVCEMKVTPIAAGRQSFSAQAFTAGREFSGAISIRGQVTIPGGPTKYILLVSDKITINVRPLPADAPPGFTGAIGKFFVDPPQLSTNRLHVGEPVHLKIIFHGENDLTRFVPPATPRSRDWQIIADKPPATGFTLIPQTDEAHETPAIPFSYFDPAAEQYFDLTIPSQPVTVIGDGLPTQLTAFDRDEKSTMPLKLSDLAPTPGKIATSLKPPQLRATLVCLQMLPLLGLLALWQWDCRRRFLEAHPEIVRRRQARRALRREKRELQKAFATGDAKSFCEHAANAMSIAVAPHYPANPQALVCADVLAQLDEANHNGIAGETVRKIFAAVDTQFALTKQTQVDSLALKASVDALLQTLEEKL